MHIYFAYASLVIFKFEKQLVDIKNISVLLIKPRTKEIDRNDYQFRKCKPNRIFRS